MSWCWVVNVSLAINILAMQLCWIGSIVVYMSSQHQKLAKRQISKRLAWAAMGLMSLLATMLFSQLHHWLAAAIIALSIFMGSWTVLTIVVPYYPKLKPVVMTGSLFFLLTALLEGTHVA